MFFIVPPPHNPRNHPEHWRQLSPGERRKAEDEYYRRLGGRPGAITRAVQRILGIR